MFLSENVLVDILTSKCSLNQIILNPDLALVSRWSFQPSMHSMSPNRDIKSERISTRLHKTNASTVKRVV